LPLFLFNFSKISLEFKGFSISRESAEKIFSKKMVQTKSISDS